MSGVTLSGPVQIEYTKKDWVSPLSQFYTYCANSNGRYVHIITEKELAVVRVRPLLKAKQSAVNNGSTASVLDLDSIQDDSPTSTSCLEETTNCQKFDEGYDSELTKSDEEMLHHGSLQYKTMPWLRNPQN